MRLASFPRIETAKLYQIIIHIWQGLLILHGRYCGTWCSGLLETIILNKFSRNIQVLALEVMRINTLRPRQDGRQFPDDIFKCIILNENL